MKRFLTLTLIAFFALMGDPDLANASTAGWKSAQEITKSTDYYWGATFTESSNIYPSHIKMQTKTSSGLNTLLCKSVKDANCISNGGWAEMIIPPCSIDDSSMCIEGLSAGKEGDLTSTTLTRVVRSKTIEGNIADQVPNGFNQSLWSYKGRDGFSDQNFSVYVLYRKVLTGKIIDFQVQVNSYEESLSSDYKEQTVSEWQKSDGTVGVTGSNGDFGCVWIEAGVCGKPVNIQEGLRLQLSLRVFDGVTGWLSGRLKQPDMQITDLNARLKRLVISAESVQVPKAYAYVKATDANSELKSQFAFPGMNLGESFLFSTMANDPNSLTFYNTWLKYWPDNAHAIATLWGFTTILGSTHPCLSDKSRVVGLVTTNAMAYEGRPPQFIDGEIQYRVASVHNDPTGKQFQGVYDLVIDSKVARCLYNYSNAPISASVSITSSEGNQNIATTVINEKNGWFRMGAYGFHYSAPTIKVKLIQESPSNDVKPLDVVKPVPTLTITPTPTPSKASLVKKSITCTKGKSKKVVAGTNPKCPTGYKKVA